MVLELFVVLDLLFNLVDLYGILPFDSVTATSEEINELLVVEYEVHSGHIHVLKPQFLSYEFLEKGAPRYLRLLLHLFTVFLVELVSMSSRNINIESIITGREVQLVILLAHFESFDRIEE